MIARDFRTMDLEACLEIRTGRIGQEVIGYQRALSAWKTLIRSLAFTSVVVETTEVTHGSRILGFGATVFVSPEFASDATSNPRPGLNERIISSIDSGRPVILSDSQLRRDNTHGGLHLVVLFTHWREGSLNPNQVAEVKLVLAKTGVERLSGYRLEELLLEALDDDDLEYIESTGVYQVVKHFKDNEAADGHNHARGLFAIDKRSAQTVVGSVATFVFQYTPPIIGFGKYDQQLLSVALEGLTDHELAVQLNLKMPALKKRWASVYERVAQVLPDLLPESDADLDRQTRGRQKRHRLLAYLRNHREELRPFIPKKAENCRPLVW